MKSDLIVDLNGQPFTGQIYGRIDCTQDPVRFVAVDKKFIQI